MLFIVVLIGMFLFLFVDVILRSVLIILEILVGFVIFVIGVLYFIYLFMRIK